VLQLPGATKCGAIQASAARATDTMAIPFKKTLITILALYLLINLVYWQDPWLWRNYVRFFATGTATEVELLPPDEEIRGDGSYVIPRATPAQRTISAPALEKMHAYATEYGSHALITIHEGVIQDEWYAPHWERNLLTQSQSMHKTLMALFIGVAIEDGKIASEKDPVGMYLEEWRDDPRGEITLEQLMQMSSGLDQYEFNLNPFSDGVKWLNSGNSFDSIARVPMLDWEPGTEYDYNNLNSEILGVVLVRLYGKRYSELLREKLWLPMGGERVRVHTDKPGGRAFTSCCLATPAMDWARFGMLLLGEGEVNGNRVVSSGWIRKMITPSPAAGHYGYQIWLGYGDPVLPADGGGSTGAIASEPFLARDTYMTWGRGQQHVFVVPSENMVIVRLGPALGREPIKPGFDITYFVNTALRDLQE
jgi:CubicO group peptidase (beta-lactamase class C family)